MECIHKWIVTVTENNEPEDVMCEKCNEIFIFVVYEGEQIVDYDEKRESDV